MMNVAAAGEGTSSSFERGDGVFFFLFLVIESDGDVLNSV